MPLNPSKIDPGRFNLTKMALKGDPDWILSICFRFLDAPGLHLCVPGAPKWSPTRLKL